MSALLEVRNLSVTYGKVEAVHKVSLAVDEGCIATVIGPNGAGKTTLLRMLATLIVPDAGGASIGGLDVVRERYAVRERIGVLSDARGLYARLTARENIRYYGALHGLSGPKLEARIAGLLHALGLDALADEGVRLARHYSQAAPCAPGRASLYTGTYQMNHRVVANGAPLEDRFDNVARLARRAGYAPALFGYTDQGVDPATVADADDRVGGGRSRLRRWRDGHGESQPGRV